MEVFVGKVDKKGRVLLPAERRKELKIKSEDEVVFQIKEVKHSRGFVRNWEGVLRGAGKDPVKLMHESFVRKGR